MEGRIIRGDRYMRWERRGRWKCVLLGVIYTRDEKEEWKRREWRGYCVERGSRLFGGDMRWAYGGKGGKE